MGRRLGFQQRNPRGSTLGRRASKARADVANATGRMMGFAEWVARAATSAERHDILARIVLLLSQPPKHQIQFSFIAIRGPQEGQMPKFKIRRTSSSTCSSDPTDH